MKRMAALTVSLLIALSLCFPVTASAAGREDCDHEYNRIYNDVPFISDVCTKCGFMRLHKTPYPLPFITRVGDVTAREAPTKFSNAVRDYSFGETLQVTGRIRNEYNNLWLQLSDGSYLYSENTAFDFDAMAARAASSVYALAGPNACTLTYSPWDGLQAQCAPSTLGVYGSMYFFFRPGGDFDLKEIDKLGLDTYLYHVFVNGEILEERYTGEKLGNILYGYMSRRVGISLKDTIRFAGLADRPQQLGDTLACFFLNDLSRCDDEDDLQIIELGWSDFYQQNRRRQGGW